ncbi:DgyrCDS11778 [Dimorphilus gyrociliatus]|uniref:DgyrCDS11778 n=1 Tax=Dimorphilus gyrociliatus TaxID=2664684 RepID=A0A7I8W8A9_9ANNE|nr:DgyrCDS11778 [Dimorphilus gyrociliatus]
MAESVNCNTAPDSWEDNNDDKGESLQNSLQHLNVNAPAFVPGQNVHAAVFVPGGGMQAQPDNEEPSKPSTVNSEPASGESQETDLVKEDPPDTWENDEEEVKTPVDDTVENTSTVTQPKKEKKLKVTPTEKKKDHLNIIFIGHVDAGKSTIGGHIMYLTGMVDKRTLEKYEKEAKEKNRESWYLSWALDTNQEERDKGKTVEVGRAYFETENKHFTILDAPGHKGFVPNMISGASQADVAVLVISARKGEFETGFERGGQTQEHAMLVRTAGVKMLIIVVNKMDDPTVKWDEKRFNEIKGKLTPYLKKCGFNPKTDLLYLPVSGLTGANLLENATDLCPWYEGPSLIKHLDSIRPIDRMFDGPLRLPVVDKYKDMGTIILGKIESGKLSRGDQVILMPNKQICEITTLWSDEEDVESALSGENVKLKLKGVEEEEVSPGFVLCHSLNLCHTGRVFDGQIVVLEHKSIICAGYSAVCHIHTCAEEVTIKALICTIDRKTGDKSKTRPRFIKQDQIAIARFELNGGVVCLESFEDFPQMGRFTLRDEGRTIGIGKVLKLVN